MTAPSPTDKAAATRLLNKAMTRAVAMTRAREEGVADLLAAAGVAADVLLGGEGGG